VWVSLTPVEGAEEILSLLLAEAADRLNYLPSEVSALLGLKGSPHQVAEAWSGILDCDADGHRLDPALRNNSLVATFAGFERSRLRSYPTLRRALARLPTRSGKYMSVLGTRCELASRAAEGLFTEARRTPGTAASQIVLAFVERLLSAVLTDCKQRDSPSYAKRWRGIRGVCRLEAISRTVQQDAHASELQHADEILDVPFPANH